MLTDNTQNAAPPQAAPGPSGDMSGLLQSSGMQDKPVDSARALGAAVRDIMFHEETAAAIIDQIGQIPIEAAAPAIVTGMIEQIVRQFPDQISEQDLFGEGKALDIIMGDLFDLAEQFGVPAEQEQYEQAMRQTIRMTHKMFQSLKNGGGQQDQQGAMGPMGQPGPDQGGGMMGPPMDPSMMGGDPGMGGGGLLDGGY